MKSIIFFMLFTLSCGFVFAQKALPTMGADDSQPNFTAPLNNTWMARYEKRQTKMIQILGLTSEQKRSLDTFNDRYVTQRAVLHEDKSLKLHERNAKAILLRHERDSKFKNVLSPEQLAKWNDLRKTQKKKAFRKK
jgi:Spy/CpxP family protein refolding chaperone